MTSEFARSRPSPPHNRTFSSSQAFLPSLPRPLSSSRILLIILRLLPPFLRPSLHLSHTLLITTPTLVAIPLCVCISFILFPLHCSLVDFSLFFFLLSPSSTPHPHTHNTHLVYLSILAPIVKVSIHTFQLPRQQGNVLLCPVATKERV
jgi:hypothetical protein